MSSLYQINEELLRIFAEIEENDGEITPEQEELVAITAENRVEKLHNYAKIINSYKADCESIKLEKKRLDRRKEIFENRIKRLEDIMLKNVELFGPVETSLFKIGTRKSKSVEIDNERIYKLNRAVFNFAREIHDNGVIAFGEDCDVQGMLDAINANLKAESTNDDFVPYSVEDLSAIKVNINSKSSVLDLFVQKDGMLEAVLDNEANFNIDTDISKTELKQELINMPNITIGEIKEKENLSIR